MDTATIIDPETVDGLDGLLGWWRHNENRRPRMAKLARKFLAVQASSTASERLFSQAGLVVPAKRKRMSGEMAADILPPGKHQAQAALVCCKRVGGMLCASMLSARQWCELSVVLWYDREPSCADVALEHVPLSRR